LAFVNPTFSWVRLAQRVPVRIKLDNVPPDLLLVAGRHCIDREDQLVGRAPAASSAALLFRSMTDWPRPHRKN
jgi:multidrug resistance efflux pump